MKILTTQMLPKRDRDKLERALCTIVDYEGDIVGALAQLGEGQSIAPICRALRLLVDGEE